uniref:CYTH domain-containing protein n=1 Tax=Kalanchoe fedtschenkoi TaxID=63787 RepID=A0A7N0TCR7_KALFE
MSSPNSSQKKAALLKDQVRLVKRKDSQRYEIAPIKDPLSFEKGFFLVIQACQLLAQKNEGILFVGLAGPSGAGKTIFSEKILNFMPSVALISMDHYNDSSRIVDGNFDDPRLTDYDTLLQNINDLKEGKQVEIPIYDFKSSSRVGYRTLEVPSSKIVIIEGIYALSEKLRPLLDLRISVTGGVHFDLVKRLLRDIQRAGQEPEQIIHQISETVYPMYKAFIEPDLQTAHIKIINKFNPFTGFQSPTYILKSSKNVTEDQIRLIMSEEHTESMEQTYDIYLLPPGEDPESCQSYLRMRNKDGKYNLMFEEWVTDNPFVISPRISFKVSVRLLGGLMALGYTIATILKRNSHVFSEERVCVKIDWLEQLNRGYIQVHGKDRTVVQHVAELLGLEGTYIPRTYIEQIQLEKLLNETLPEDLKTKLSMDDELVSSPVNALSQSSADRVTRRSKHHKSGMSHSYSTERDKNLSSFTRFDTNNGQFEYLTTEAQATLANQGAMNQLSGRISSLNDRMDDFTNHIEELNSKLTLKTHSASQQSLALQSETCNGFTHTSYLVSGLDNNGLIPSSVLPHSLPSSQLTKESALMDKMTALTRGQRQIMHQVDNLSSLLRESLELKSQQRTRTVRKITIPDLGAMGLPIVLVVAIGGFGFILFKGFGARN